MESFSKFSEPRHLRVLAGPANWCRMQARQQIIGHEAQTFWWGEGAPDGVQMIAKRDARARLGQECRRLVIDAHAGFDPEALGALSGTLVGGGCLLLLTPPLHDWEHYPDPEHARIAVAPLPASAVSGRFLARLARVLEAHGVAVFTPDSPPPSPPSPKEPPLNLPLRKILLPNCQPKGTPSKSPPHSRGRLVSPSPSNEGEGQGGDILPGDHPEGRTTPDQHHAITAVLKVARGHRRRPLVLTAHRGRGKSAALGLAAAELLQQPGYRILLTAPRREQASSVLHHAGEAHHPTASLRFMPPDVLLRESPPADLLLVDEAAAIPTPLLSALLHRYARIAFATTVHGYEGTGRGFALRFRQVLEAQTPGWRECTLETPIRWRVDDPLEALIFRLLLLDAEPVAATRLASLDLQHCTLEPLEPARLAQDETTLREIFGLLILAHYQTSPLDLRYLLDGPNVEGLILRHGPHVVGVALCTREGRLDATLTQEIPAGKRRPRGHLLPQTLATHLGQGAALGMDCLRIMRIAIHPAVQRRGLGRHLLQGVVDYARGQHIELLGSSFAADPPLLHFWASAGLAVVRLGFQRDAASGCHSALVLRGLRDSAETLAAQLRERFLEQLPYLLGDPLREIDPILATQLLVRAHHGALAPQDQRDLADFLAGRRGYEDTLLAVRRGVLAGLANGCRVARLTTLQRDALILRVVQQHPWAAVAKRLGLAGRSAVLTTLREALAVLTG